MSEKEASMSSQSKRTSIIGPEKLDKGKFFGALFFYALAIAQGSFKADDEGVMNVQLELLSKQTEIAGSLYGYFNEHFSKAIAQP